MTIILHCHWLEFWGHDPEFLRLLRDIVDLRFVKYDLFNSTNLIQNLIYIRFGIILTQFSIYFLRQEHQIDVLYVSFKT